MKALLRITLLIVSVVAGRDAIAQSSTGSQLPSDENRCATCHGEAGDGNGELAGALNPRPRDFRQADWQESVSDAHIETVISRGGPSAGLSPIMAAHPDLDPGQLASLRAYVRSLAR